MTAPLTEAQARDVVAAAGCGLGEGPEGFVAVRGLVTKAWGKTVVGVATMLREHASSRLKWKADAFDRVRREFDEAIVAGQRIEAAAGLARRITLAPASLAADLARAAVRVAFDASLERLRSSEHFCLGPDQALACLAAEFPQTDAADLIEQAIARANRFLLLAELAVSREPVATAKEGAP